MYKILITILILTGISDAELMKEYYDSGEIVAIVNLINGVPNGETKVFYKNGKLRRILQYKNGKILFTKTIEYAYQSNDTYSLHLNGKNKPSIFKKNGKVYNGKLVMHYNPDKKGELGLIGGTFLIGNIHNYDNGEISAKGPVRLIVYFNNGLMEGKMSLYHRNGEISRVKYFKKGYPSGKWEWFTKRGIKHIVENYKNGKQNGLRTYYFYDTYVINIKTNYKNGLKDGKEEKYFKNGNLSSETTFMNGKENGTHIEYWKNSLISNKITMKEGKAISGTWWHDDGRIGGAMSNAQFKSFYLDY